MIYPTQCLIFSGDEATINAQSGYTVCLTEASLVSVDTRLALRERNCVLNMQMNMPPDVVLQRGTMTAIVGPKHQSHRD